jgi:hypothetical protein
MNKSKMFWLGAVCAAMISMHALGQNSCVNPDSASAQICINMVRAGFGLGGGVQETRIDLEVHFFNSYPGSKPPDFYQVRFSETNNAAGLAYVRQDKTGKGFDGDWKTTQPYIPGVEGPPYLIQVQWCFNGVVFSSSTCGPWANVTYTPPPPQYIAPPTGHAQPGSSPGGSDKRANPGQAPPAGPDLAEVKRPCVQGYVWRQVVTNDYVCVTPQTRDQAWRNENLTSHTEKHENRMKNLRLADATSSLLAILCATAVRAQDHRMVQIGFVEPTR